MKRSPLPVLLLLGAAAWTAGQAVLPDMGLEWADRLDAVAADRSAQALSAALFLLAGVLLVAAAVVAAVNARHGRGATAVRTGTVMLGLGGVWLAAGRGVFNLHMYQVTDPAVGRDAALAVVSADVGLGFVPLVVTLPALLLGPVVLSVGLWRSGGVGRLPQAALAAWVVGIATFVASEFTAKAGEIAGLGVASVGLVLLGTALGRRASTGRRTPADVVPAGAR